jgi:hypothetical protein
MDLFSDDCRHAHISVELANERIINEKSIEDQTYICLQSDQGIVRVKTWFSVGYPNSTYHRFAEKKEYPYESVLQQYNSGTRFWIIIQSNKCVDLEYENKNSFCM